MSRYRNSILHMIVAMHWVGFVVLSEIERKNINHATVEVFAVNSRMKKGCNV